MNLQQLEALAAIVDEGTFEAAADALRITPSAVSQRIKALESSAGQVLLRRAVPCTPTEAGTVLLRTARQMAAVAAEARAALGGAAARSTTPIAVNADSLATWFVRVLEAAAGWTDTALELHVEDQDHCTRLLRRGDVVGAVTSDPSPVNGCRSEPLGTMRYVAAAAPALAAAHARGGAVDWARMPVLRFNSKDDLQARTLCALDPGARPPLHTVPSSEGFVAAAAAGLGWGMVPEPQLAPHLAAGSLVGLPGAPPEDVPLHWQAWTLDAERLSRLADAVRTAARAGLRPPG